MILSASQLMDNWKQCTVLVLGEAMLDCYLKGSADRLSQEAPVPVVTINQRQDFPGGAANTAANVTSLGANTLLLSVVGKDVEGDRLRRILVDRGLSTEHLLSSSHRATLAKQRVVASDQLVVRFDHGSTQALHAEMEQRVIDRLVEQFPQCDAVLISDYGYGILTPRIIQTLVRLQAEFSRTLVVDAKQLEQYREAGVTAVKPNYGEAIQLLGLSKQATGRAEQLSLCGDRLLNVTGAAIVAVTLDCEGAIVFERGQAPYHTTADPMPSHYTSGAGDTYVSVLTLALAAGAPTRTAAFLAASATATVVTQPGTSVCTPDALQRSLMGDRTPTMTSSPSY